MSGEAYGINLTDPTARQPAIYIILDEFGTDGYELGSVGVYANALYVINALSRKQRDALKTVLMSGIIHVGLDIYQTFSNGLGTGAPIAGTELNDHIRVMNTQELNNDERSFWVSTVYTRYNILE